MDPVDDVMGAADGGVGRIVRVVRRKDWFDVEPQPFPAVQLRLHQRIPHGMERVAVGTATADDGDLHDQSLLMSMAKYPATARQMTPMMVHRIGLRSRPASTIDARNTARRV